MSEIVRASDVVFSYRGSDFELRVPDLRIEAGAAVGLTGASGCGKSTLLGLLSGLLGASGGSLEVAGTQLVGLADGARRRHRLRSLGLVFQDYPVVEHLDATENVLLPYRVGQLRLTREVRDRAVALLGSLGLAGKERRKPAQLSQGERQRVTLARALITQPRLVLADEPTTGLDPDRTAAVMDLLRSQCAERGVTLVVVTHDVAVVGMLDKSWDVSQWARGHL